MAIVAQKPRGSVRENELSGETPSLLRKSPSLPLAREAEERTQRVSHTNQAPLKKPTKPKKNVPPAPASTGANTKTFSPPPAQPLIRTVQGNTVSWTTQTPFTISTDSDGKHIRFSHCPGLVFPSMQYAFDYFHVQAKLHNQRASQARQQQWLQAAEQDIQVAQRHLQAEQQGYTAERLGLGAGQLANFPLCSFEPVWQFNTPIRPNDAQSVASLPTPPSHSVSDSHATEANSLHSSASSPPESPPQNLFAEPTPHAQDILAQSRFKLPVRGLDPWFFQPPATKEDHCMQSLWPTPHADQATTLSNSHRQSSTWGSVLPQTLTNEVEVSDQPLSLNESHPLPASYAHTVFPQTLYRKDRNVLGVPLSAGIDE